MLRRRIDGVFLVLSAGPDDIEDTEDDVRVWWPKDD
jgi:hypothetical protein